MDMRKKVMGHMAVGILVDTGRIDLTRSEMAGCCILQIGEVIDTDTIPFLVLIHIKIVYPDSLIS